MISTVEDQLVIKNIEESLETLIQDIQSAYKQLNYPEPSEYDIRQLIATVNHQGILEGKTLESLNLYG